MKFALPLLLLTVFAMNACTTLANRRDLYRADEAHGPYTDKVTESETAAISDTASHARVKNH